MTMMESQNTASFDSESFGKKEKHELIDSTMNANSIAFEEKERDDSPKYKVSDFSMANEIGNKDSPAKEGQNGQLHHLSGWDKDADSLSSDSYDDIDREQRNLEHEVSATIAEFADYNANNSRDSSSPCNGASDLYETDSKMFTDKSVLEYEVPALEVCYKEIDCQILKDICMDEGRPEKKINVIGSCKDEESGILFVQPPNHEDHFEANKDASLECTNDLSADEHGSKDEKDGNELVSQGRLESSFDNSFEKVAAKGCDLENSMQTGETNYGATGKAETDFSEEDSLVGTKLPIQDFGGGNKILDEKPASDGPTASSAEAGGTGQDVKPGSLLYNSKVESKSITFNFKSPVPEVVDNGNGITENTEELSTDSEDLPKDVNAENLTDSVDVEEHKVANISDDSLASNKIEGPGNDGQAVEPNAPQHEKRNSGSVSAVSQLQHDLGETSFSAASLISYSGPIAFSGSLSHRSDGSTTSGKSFAFPVLQSEWNSSPVRMAKADRRHFRKHKGWRSGLLCCRF